MAFGNLFAVEPGTGGASDYRLSGLALPVLTRVDDSSPGGCGGTDGERVETRQEDIVVGCDPFGFDLDPPGPVPCTALNRSRLRGAVDYTTH